MFKHVINEKIPTYSTLFLLLFSLILCVLLHFFKFEFHKGETTLMSLFGIRQSSNDSQTPSATTSKKHAQINVKCNFHYY